jgi:hypothetical protein
MAQTQTFIIPKHKRGDDWDGLQFLIKVNGTALNLTGATIAADFKLKSKTGQLKKQMTVGSGVTITDAAGGIFKMDGFKVDMPVGIYYFDVEITVAGNTKTRIEGTWEITQDVTNSPNT